MPYTIQDCLFLPRLPLCTWKTNHCFQSQLSYPERNCTPRQKTAADGSHHWCSIHKFLVLSRHEIRYAAMFFWVQAGRFGKLTACLLQKTAFAGAEHCLANRWFSCAGPLRSGISARRWLGDSPFDRVVQAGIATSHCRRHREIFHQPRLGISLPGIFVDRDSSCRSSPEILK